MSTKRFFCFVMTAIVMCAGMSAKKFDGKDAKMNAGKPEVIDYQSQALGSPIPKWVVAVSEGQKKKVVKALDLDSSDMVFVLMNKGSDLDFLKTWTDQVDARAEVASSIEQTVAQLVESELSIREADELTKKRAAKIYSTAMTNLTLNGLEKEASYWIQTRTKKPGVKNAKKSSDWTTEYTYYVVFTMKSKIFNKQLKKAMDDVQDNDDQTKFLKETLTKKLTEAVLPADNEEVGFDDVDVDDSDDE